MMLYVYDDVGRAVVHDGCMVVGRSRSITMRLPSVALRASSIRVVEEVVSQTLAGCGVKIRL
jgi:hypothetical protein